MLTATVCVALSGAGLAMALLTAWRRRFLHATRIAAWALLPIGLYMTGLATLGRKVGVAVGKWGADLVFKPTVWIGILVLAVSALLFMIVRVAGKRSPRRRKVTGDDGGVPAVAPQASTGALEPGRGAQRQPAPSRKKAKASGDDGLSDFSEIEEILRRRGI